MSLLKAKLLELYGSDQVDKKSLAKARAHVHGDMKLPKPFIYEGITITVEELAVENDMLKVVVDADCPTDNPYHVANPPLQVVVKEAEYGPLVDGVRPVIKPRKVKESPEEALQVIVGEAVLSVAERLGWSK